MNPRVPYDPRRRRLGPNARPEGGCGTRLFWMAMPLAAVAFVLVWRSRATGPGATTLSPSGPASTPAIVTLTPRPGPSLAPAEATPTEEPELPTSTYLPPPSPSPTALRTPAPTQYYTTQSGDTLPALAARFGVNPADIAAPQGLKGSTTLAEGQLLVIPRVLSDTGPDNKLIPDSELVFSGAAAGFEPQQFALEQGGYLGRVEGFADGRTQRGGDVLLAVARDHSINPRLLVALLDYQSGWVSSSQPSAEGLNYPFGLVHPYLHNLNAQAIWASNNLATGYYGWRAGWLTELHFPDGSALRLDPALNAGTVALQFFFAQLMGRPEWDDAVSGNGFIATYYRMFGDPFARALDPLLPADLVQVPLSLPFLPGHTWSYTGGPHGAWERGGAQAALDFAPGASEGGCAASSDWVTASAAGLVLRSGNGVVELDLDGDGREATGWNILYLHIAEADRVKQGVFVERGDKLGHPSCEGGRATGTHVHIARKYNGEWILADGVIPFNLSGWVAAAGKGEYLGTLTRDGVTVTACTCTSASTAITADP